MALLWFGRLSTHQNDLQVENVDRSRRSPPFVCGVVAGMRYAQLEWRLMRCAVIGLAGKIETNHEALTHWFDALLPIGNAHDNIKSALEHTYDDLVRTALQIGNLLAVGKMF